jgi:hypothetical protein
MLNQLLVMKNRLKKYLNTALFGFSPNLAAHFASLTENSEPL